MCWCSQVCIQCVLAVQMHLHCGNASAPLWLGSLISRVIFQKEEPATHSWKPPGKQHLQPGVMSPLQFAHCIFICQGLCRGLNSVSPPRHPPLRALLVLFKVYKYSAFPPQKNLRQVINIYLIKFFYFKIVCPKCKRSIGLIVQELCKTCEITTDKQGE